MISPKIVSALLQFLPIFTSSHKMARTGFPALSWTLPQDPISFLEVNGTPIVEHTRTLMRLWCHFLFIYIELITAIPHLRIAKIGL